MRNILAAAFLALCCLQTVGCAKKAPPPAKPLVTVATPLPLNVIDWDDYVGQFVAVDSVDIRPRVSGYLVSVGFKDGDYVRKGQTLFVIDPRPYQAALDQAKGQAAHAAATAVNAHTEAVRGQTLIGAHAISQQAYDSLVAAERQAKADQASADAAVKAAALNLSFTRVIAPLAGRVSDRRIAPGNLVTADTTVLTNISTTEEIADEGFGWLESFKIKRRRTAGGAEVMASCEVVVSDWLFGLFVNSRRALAIDSAYFDLQGAIR